MALLQNLFLSLTDRVVHYSHIFSFASGNEWLEKHKHFATLVNVTPYHVTRPELAENLRPRLAYLTHFPLYLHSIF
jgi:hypothetical protein